MPPELMSALTGGGAPPGGGLEALLGGGGPPPGMPPGPPPEAAPKTPSSILEEMIALAQEYLSVEQDAVDKQTMAEVLAKLQRYLAEEQREDEAAFGVTPASKAVQRRLGGPPA